MGPSAQGCWRAQSGSGRVIRAEPGSSLPLGEAPPVAAAVPWADSSEGPSSLLSATGASQLTLEGRRTPFLRGKYMNLGWTAG